MTLDHETIMYIRSALIMLGKALDMLKSANGMIIRGLEKMDRNAQVERETADS
jgi:hypothetical protein